MTTSSQRLYITATKSLTSLNLITSSPLASYNLDVLSFFNELPDGMHLTAKWEEDVALESKIERLIRTPDGNSVAVLRHGSADIYSSSRREPRLRYLGSWSAFEHIAVIDSGQKVILYSKDSESLMMQPSSSLVAVQVPRIASLFCIMSEGTTAILIAITSDHSVVRIRVSQSAGNASTMAVQSVTTLPLDSPPQIILPLCSTPWNDSLEEGRECNTLLSISSNGTLAFWVPVEEKNRDSKWTCTSQVRTGRTEPPIIARCNSARKTALGRFNLFSSSFHARLMEFN